METGKANRVKLTVPGIRTAGAEEPEGIKRAQESRKEVAVEKESGEDGKK